MAAYTCDVMAVEEGDGAGLNDA